jgi:hypothetical protein
MSQFLIACFVFMAAWAATLHHRQAARIAATELARLRTEQTAANSTLASFQTRTAASAKRHAELSLDLTSASAELKASSEVALRARTEPDPATEGAWPTGKPYFHLPKRLLSDIGFTALTPDGAPTPEAIALLGLTPSERDNLHDAWADFRFDLQELQRQSAERMPDTNSVPDPNRTSIRFKLSGLTNQIPRLREQLDARLTTAIGATRTQLLHSPMEARIEDLTTPIGDRDCIVGYHAERAADGTVQHYLRFEAGDGSSMHQYVVDFMRWGQPTSDGVSHSTAKEPYRTSVGSPLWHYRHLFGDQPLLPLP